MLGIRLPLGVGIHCIFFCWGSAAIYFFDGDPLPLGVGIHFAGDPLSFGACFAGDPAAIRHGDPLYSFCWGSAAIRRGGSTVFFCWGSAAIRRGDPLCWGSTFLFFAGAFLFCWGRNEHLVRIALSPFSRFDRVVSRGRTGTCTVSLRGAPTTGPRSPRLQQRENGRRRSVAAQTPKEYAQRVLFDNAGSLRGTVKKTRPLRRKSSSKAVSRQDAVSLCRASFRFAGRARQDAVSLAGERPFASQEARRRRFACRTSFRFAGSTARRCFALQKSVLSLHRKHGKTLFRFKRPFANKTPFRFAEERPFARRRAVSLRRRASFRFTEEPARHFASQKERPFASSRARRKRPFASGRASLVLRFRFAADVGRNVLPATLSLTLILSAFQGECGLLSGAIICGR